MRKPGVTPKSAEAGSGTKANESFHSAVCDLVADRNKRTVWTVPTAPYKGAHFATFPPALITPCILAGCPLGGTVLDPFGGSGTTGEVAEANGRNSVLIELNPEYAELAKKRTAQGGLFCSVAND
jgi:site-specific DNA-methyltransferase (adenine-specific)